MSYISLTLIIKEDVILTEDLVEFISQSFYQIDKTSFVYLFIYLFICLFACLYMVSMDVWLSIPAEHVSGGHYYGRSLLLCHV